MAKTETFAARVNVDLKRRFTLTCALLGVSTTEATGEALAAWCDMHGMADVLREVVTRRLERHNMLLGCGVSYADIQAIQAEHGDDALFWFRRIAVARRRAGMVLTAPERELIGKGDDPEDLEGATKLQRAAMGVVEGG